MEWMSELKNSRYVADGGPRRRMRSTPMHHASTPISGAGDGDVTTSGPG
jgi:hypothetical protein